MWSHIEVYQIQYVKSYWSAFTNNNYLKSYWSSPNYLHTTNNWIKSAKMNTYKLCLWTTYQIVYWVHSITWIYKQKNFVQRIYQKFLLRPYLSSYNPIPSWWSRNIYKIVQTNSKDWHWNLKFHQCSNLGSNYHHSITCSECIFRTTKGDKREN